MQKRQKKKYDIFLKQEGKKVNTLADHITESNECQINAIVTIHQLILVDYPENTIALIFKNTKVINKLVLLIEKELDEIHSPELNNGPKYVFMIIKEESFHHKRTLEVILIMIKICFQSYKLFIENNYLEAFHNFRWILQFIYYIRKLKILELNAFLQETERGISILCAICYINDCKNSGDKWLTYSSLKTHLDEPSVLEALLLGIIDTTSQQYLYIQNLKDKYVISKFFQNLGYIYEAISLFKGKLCEYEFDNSKLNIALKVDNALLNEMVLKYIISMTMKLEGDPELILCCNKIIQAVILYGGIRIETLAFFIKLRDFYLHSTKDNPNLNESREISKYTLTGDCLNLAISMIKEYENFRNDICPIYLPENLLQTINGSVIQVEEVPQNQTPFNNEENSNINVLMKTIKFKVKTKWYAKTHRLEEINNSEQDTGKLWIDFWWRCMNDNNDNIPPEARNMYNNFSGQRER